MKSLLSGRLTTNHFNKILYLRAKLTIRSAFIVNCASEWNKNERVDCKTVTMIMRYDKLQKITKNITCSTLRVGKVLKNDWLLAHHLNNTTPIPHYRCKFILRKFSSERLTNCGRELKVFDFISTPLRGFTFSIIFRLFRFSIFVSVSPSQCLHISSSQLFTIILCFYFISHHFLSFSSSG